MVFTTKQYNEWSENNAEVKLTLVLLKKIQILL